MTDDQSLLRISIALWASVASLRIAETFDSIACLASFSLALFEANEPFSALSCCAGLFDEKKTSCDIVTIPQLSKVDTVKSQLFAW